ncbi:UbiA prenyltransferase family protein [Hymenobacter daecheongensis DSM 21074]|uniref:UbiA prenyltransferase family protein n=1 Tax=Hymenobacter daecheongensis DSM 21074 TaxID=1121955 RepID=A0A1M6AA55_9BACT|nr:UbiA family prenyltransferase [Hymenobacter daecheongensis]SHI33308.1 UbiA prenyltransferase family protein [Hymenobacter daecheongensis DSM 21074]
MLPGTLRELSGPKRALDVVLYSSGLVAAAATALTGATFLFWHAPIPARLGALIFAATLFLYNLDSVLPYKYRQQAVLSARKRWVLRHRRGLLALALGSLAVAVVLFVVDGWWHLRLFWGHLAAISLLYSLPVVRRRGHWRALRDLPLLKMFLIAYVWSAVTVWVPALRLGKALDEPAVLVLFARRFFFILNLALIFDIRDFTKDQLSGTRTFPGLFGLRATKVLGLIFLAVSAVLVPPGVSAAHGWVLLLPTLLAGVILWFADETRPEYYFALLADGLMLVQFAVAYWVA